MLCIHQRWQNKDLGPLLLIWIDFGLSMNNWLQETIMHLASLTPFFISFSAEHVAERYGTVWYENIIKISTEVKTNIISELSHNTPNELAVGIYREYFGEHFMMTSSYGNIFHVTDPFRGEFDDHWSIPLTKSNDAELWCFLWSAPEQTVE